MSQATPTSVLPAAPFTHTGVADPVLGSPMPCLTSQASQWGGRGLDRLEARQKVCLPQRDGVQGV